MTLAEVMALPAMTDLVSAGKALGMGRTRSYEIAQAGMFPCRVVRVGRIYTVPTVGLLAVLGITVPGAGAGVPPGWRKHCSMGGEGPGW